MRVPPSPPLELLKLRSATAVYIGMLRDVEQWCEQAIDVNALVNPELAGNLRYLRDQLRPALEERPTDGSPMAIAQVLAEILGES